MLGDVEQQLDILSADANKHAEERALIAEQKYAQLAPEFQPTSNSLSKGK